MQNLFSSFYFFTSLLIFSACNSNNTENKVESTPFDFSQYVIEKNGVGPITLGKKISDVQPFLSDFKKELVPAWDFGFDGGDSASAVLYSLGEDPFIALIPARGTDSIIAIIALHSKLKTRSGIAVGTEVRKILELFPDAKCTMNFQTEDEFIAMPHSYVSFVFSSQNERLVEYPDTLLDGTFTPTNQSATVDWIEIFKSTNH